LSVSSFDETRSKHERNVLEGGEVFWFSDFPFDLLFTCVQSSTVTEGWEVLAGEELGWSLGWPELTGGDVAAVDDVTDAKVTDRFDFGISEIFVGFVTVENC
jgi:hypothetical protein